MKIRRIWHYLTSRLFFHPLPGYLYPVVMLHSVNLAATILNASQVFKLEPPRHCARCSSDVTICEDNTKTGFWKTEKENIKVLLMKYSLKIIQAIVKKINNNKSSGKKTWSGKHCKKKIHYTSAPFQKIIIGGYSG